MNRNFKDIVRFVVKNEVGSTNLEAMVVTACFAVVAIMACLAMVGQAGL